MAPTKTTDLTLLQKTGLWTAIGGSIAALLAFCFNVSSASEKQKIDYETQKTSIQIRLNDIEIEQKQQGTDVKGIQSDVGELKGMLKVMLQKK